MREIKFRAWDKKRKRMFAVTTLNASGAVSVFIDDDGLYLLPAEQIELIQYTGLKDKNGKEIYEGDIMRFDAISYEIYWSDDFSGWHNRRTDGGERIYGSNGFEEVTRFGSVIGNIYENPELLDEEDGEED